MKVSKMIDQYTRIATRLNYLSADNAALIVTPLEVMERLVALIPESVLKDPNSRFLDSAAGIGTSGIALLKVLTKYHTEEVALGMIYLVEIEQFKVDAMKRIGFKNVYHADSLTKIWNMKFDVDISNPPYNLRTGDGGDSGTIGDKTYYRKFASNAFTNVKEGGQVIMVTMKGVLQHLDKMGVQVDKVNLMTDEDYWKYDTLYFVARNEPKTTELVYLDKIISKMYDPNNPWEVALQGASLMQMERDKGVVVSEDGDVLLKLEGKGPAVYGTNTDNIKVWTGPKFMCTILESTKSYTATDEPACPHCGCVVETDTLEDAKRLKLFVENNKAWKFATKRLKSKGHGKELRRLKRFDLSQIITGFEYPKEFALTEEDITIIEASTK